MTLRIAFLIAVHNRNELTRQCLEVLSQVYLLGMTMSVYVVDDGSSDGTSRMIEESFPGVTLLRGDGTLYWGGAMRMAEEAARSAGADRLVWINDDARLDKAALERVLSESQIRGDSTVICCALRDPITATVAYSGIKSTRRWGVFHTTQRVNPSAVNYLGVDTFNGNCVVIPGSVVESIGSIDPVLVHHYGDFDYGLRATAAGFRVLLAPGFVGETARNGVAGTFRDTSLSIRSRVELLLGRKGYPVVEKAHYLRRHNRQFWWLQVGLVFAGQISWIVWTSMRQRFVQPW